MIVKGQNVNLLMGGQVIAASKSCDFSLTANTTDAAAKDDANPEWDNSEFTYYDWSASNESFVVDIAALKNLLKQAAGMGTTKTVEVQFQIDNSSGAAYMCKKGTAAITSLEVDAPAEDFVSINISFEGVSALTNGTYTAITPVTGVRNKMRGKSLMLAIEMGTGSDKAYQTICAATSHKLSISAQTADVRTKDINDMAISKEITGYSMSLSTETLVDIHDSQPKCVGSYDIVPMLMAGTTVAIKFGYYANAAGAAVGATKSWGAPDSTGGVVVSGNFLISSCQFSGANKDNSTFSAEFTCKGVPTIA